MMALDGTQCIQSGQPIVWVVSFSSLLLPQAAQFYDWVVFSLGPSAVNGQNVVYFNPADNCLVKIKNSGSLRLSSSWTFATWVYRYNGNDLGPLAEYQTPTGNGNSFQINKDNICIRMNEWCLMTHQHLVDHIYTEIKNCQSKVIKTFLAKYYICRHQAINMLTTTLYVGKG